MKKILELFYALSDIRVVIFDEQGTEIMAYPERPCSFCSEVRKREELFQKCAESDRLAFKKAAEAEGCFICRCHAGLTEATAPLRSGGKIIGYMMFGQITDIKSKEELAALVGELNEKYQTSARADGIRYKSKKQLDAAAELLRICTDYIILKDMAVHEGEKKLERAKRYIDDHIDEDIEISRLCDELGLSRTRLYELFSSEVHSGVAAYIRERRMIRARTLLKETELTVSSVAARCGFADYNYFSRLYKRRWGISPVKERESR